jgi:hypothetical protein
VKDEAVCSREVPSPDAVRFAYIPFQDTDLFNAEGVASRSLSLG